jgi:type II secretory pathway pseudopilin PulG
MGKRTLRPALHWSRSQAGYSLVEVAVVAAILLIVVLGMGSLMSQSAQTQRALNQKVETIIFKNYLADLMSSNKHCSSVIQGIEVRKHNPNFKLNLDRLQDGTLNSTLIRTETSADQLNDPNEKIKKYLNGVKDGMGVIVQNITFGEVVPMGASLYKGELAVHLKYENGIDRHPVKIPILFSLPDNAPPITIIGNNACDTNSTTNRLLSCLLLEATNDAGQKAAGPLTVEADVCTLSEIFFDQSDSGNSGCFASKSTNGKWSLSLSHVNSPTSCRWTCYGNIPTGNTPGCTKL